MFGAAGYTGALSARLLDRHPAFELRTVTARSDVGRRLDELYPHHRVPLELEELDLDRHGDVDAAVVAYPHGAAAELVAELHRRGVRVVDLSADFRLRDAAVYEEWYRAHPEPELLAQRRLRPARALPRADRATPRSSPTPAATRPPRCWRWRRWPAPG